MGKANAITNVEIADCLLRAGGPVTVKRLLELLAEYHPSMEVEVTFVRARLAAFERSHNVICVVNKDVRPATYHMMSVNQEFFRGARKGRPLDFSHTVIPKKSRETDHASLSALCFSIWYQIAEKRYALTAINHLSHTAG
ncbi:hypothetical protein UXN85_20595 [Enterobacter hormaechei]